MTEKELNLKYYYVRFNFQLKMNYIIKLDGVGPVDNRPSTD